MVIFIASFVFFLFVMGGWHWGTSLKEKYYKVAALLSRFPVAIFPVAIFPVAIKLVAA